jgi:hypothetical protein
MRTAVEETDAPTTAAGDDGDPRREADIFAPRHATALARDLSLCTSYYY